MRKGEQAQGEIERTGTKSENRMKKEAGKRKDGEKRETERAHTKTYRPTDRQTDTERNEARKRQRRKERKETEGERGWGGEGERHVSRENELKGGLRERASPHCWLNLWSQLKVLLILVSVLLSFFPFCLNLLSI
mmetsp:Transcript_14620/g.29474  ORF Transcript_14620/g.29474 Transcript_14620/m.29474 type:complete len:135 (+) Transcript_14620:1066-1470(+)